MLLLDSLCPIVNANSIGSNFAFVLVVKGKNASSWCCHQTLHTTKSQSRDAVEGVSVPISWFVDSQRGRSWFLSLLVLSSLPLLLSLSATWSLHLTCTIFFVHQNLPPFPSAHPPRNGGFPAGNNPFLTTLVFCQVGKLHQVSEEPRDC